ncbi:hypothetical protein ACG2F4_04500 [Halalkalibaculum sp. DA3122]|uniref:hypothetical protein n=1 Tax=Halalkalibaculum sp. DA3122 TaxID=3373607 RepID=UPI00375420E1
MVKKLCFFLLLPVLGYSQSLNISVADQTAGNQYATFGFDQQNVTISGGGISFPVNGRQFGNVLTFGVTPGYRAVGILQNSMDGAKSLLLNTAADTLAAYSTISLNYSDPSLGIYPFDSGEVLLRNNIANFTLYNSMGAIITSGSSGSQSERGESISEVAFDPLGKTIVMYTPKIKQENGVGSQAVILSDDNATNNIFYSGDRSIKHLSIADNGQFVVLVTEEEGTDDAAVILDRYGNELNSISSEEELDGAYFAGDNEEVLLHSRRRALVYSTLQGERLGSTSFRSPLVLAQYFSEDQTIIGVTGNKVENTDIYRDLEFHAVNLDKREIARTELDGALATDPNIDLKFLREGRGQYRLMGSNKIINLRASF